MKRYLYDFNHTIRYSFQLLTYDELRSFICFKLKDSNVIVPNEQHVPAFLQGLFKLGVIKEAYDSYNTLMSNIEQLQNIYKQASVFGGEGSRFLFIPPDVQDLMMSTPLYIAFQTKVDTSLEILKKYWKNDQFIIDDVFTDLDMLRMEDVDKLTKMYRDKPSYIDQESKL